MTITITIIIILIIVIIIDALAARLLFDGP